MRYHITKLGPRCWAAIGMIRDSAGEWVGGSDKILPSQKLAAKYAARELETYYRKSAIAG